jgi:hypothetical protein
MNKLVVTIIIILLPGIIATIISDKLTYHSKWDSFKYGLYSLILGFFTYVFLQILVYIYDIFIACSLSNISWHHLTVWSNTTSENIDISFWEVGLAIILSVPIAFIASWSINYKILNKFGKYIHVTSKYGDENLFSYFLNSKEVDWVYVRDQTRGLTYQG